MEMTLQNEEILKPIEVRKLLNISNPTLILLDREWKLKPFRIGKTGKTGGQRRYRLSEVLDFMKNYGK